MNQRVLSRRPRGPFRAVCAMFALVSAVVWADAAMALEALSSRPRVPLLIRNEHVPLVRVIVDAGDQADVGLRAITFSLAGTDDVSEIAALTVYGTDQNDELPSGRSGLTFPEKQRFGETMPPAETISFRGERALSAGKNVFWLSCRMKDSANLSHHVSAVCTQIETTLGVVKPKTTSPDVPQRIGIALRKHQDDGVHTYRIAALSTTPKGTLLCVYDMRRSMGRDLQEDIDIGLSRSLDGGLTWQPVKVIIDMGEYGGLPQAENGCSDPGIVIDQQTGEIFCFAVWMNGKPGQHQWIGDGSEPGFEIGKTAQFLMVRSQDDGVTWSKPENLTRTLKQESWWLLAPSPQSGFSMADGTLVMPVQGREGQADLATFATLMVSQDHGQTWTVAEPAYRGGNECQAALLSDGSIMLNMRNDRERFRAIAVTKDLGKTWEPHATSRNTLIEPNCNGSLLHVDTVVDGKSAHLLLFANPHTQQGRTHQTIQVSFDDGQTWPESHHLLLDEGLGAGYPSLTRVDDEHVGIVYEGSQAQLTFERIPLRELLHLRPAAAQPVSGASSPAAKRLSLR